MPACLSRSAGPATCTGPIALCVGAVVCIAAANAGGTSQDLKTGYLVGATPIYQQIGLVIGVVTSAVVIGWTTLYLHSVFGIGSTADCRRRRRR